MFVRCADGRKLASELIAWPMVKSVSFGADGKNLTAEVTDAHDFRQRLCTLLADREVGIEILNPLDDNLAAVFSYLVT